MSPAAPVEWALAYARHGLNILPCRADKSPLTPNGLKDATCDRAILDDWGRRWPFADWGWALPPNILVVDLDEKNRKHGLVDFERLDGRNPYAVETPTATTRSGGLHLYFIAARTYNNAVAIQGAGIDTRTAGGYVLLPGCNNGRQWLKRLRSTPLATAPAWLDDALNTASPPPNLLRPVASRKEALSALERALARIIAAPRGTRDDTRHRQCFFVGGLIGRGDLDYATGLNACRRAAQGMVGSNDFRDLNKRVEASIRRGMERTP
jgi:hypothetical protein